MAATPTIVTLRYDVEPTRDDWVLPEEPVPESLLHSQAVDLIKALLLHWVARTGLDAQVAPNLAFRWVEKHPKVGVDPDLCLISPSTPEGDELESLRAWAPGHSVPKLAIEVVSKGHPYKDYVTTPEKYAASGVPELWIFDPAMAGPKARGGPHRIQIWLRNREGAFERAYAGDGPAFSPALRAWLFAVDEGRKLRLADDREGTSWWHTEAEAALARIAELEAELRRRG